MSVLDVKLRRDLWRAKGMLSAVVAIVAVGIGCLSGFFATSWNLNRAESDYYRTCRMADFWVQLKKAPVEDALGRASIPGVAVLRSRITSQVVVDLPGVARPLSGQLVSLPADGSNVINDLVLAKGGLFTRDGADEVVVSKDFAVARGLEPGDYVTLVASGESRTLRIVGWAISSEFVFMTPPGSIVPEPDVYGVFWVSRRTAQDLMGFSGACNSLVGQFTPKARLDPQPVLDELSARLAPYGVFAAYPLARQPSNLNLNAELGGLATMATMMPLIFLSVAALVLNVLMMRLAAQQRAVIGTLKALGYGRGAVYGHFLKVGLLTGLAGGLAGVGLGWLIAEGMTWFYKSFFTFPTLENHFYPTLAIISLAVAMGFGVMGTAKGVHTVAKLNPAEAMHENPPTQGGKILIERVGLFWRNLGFRWQMALRNVFRNRVRSLSGLFAGAMGAAILVCTFGMLDSLQYMVNFQFQKVILADYTVSLRDHGGTDVLYDLAALPGVEKAEPTLAVDCTFSRMNRSKKGSVTGLVPGATMTVPRDENGRAISVPKDGVIMAARLARELGVEVGQKVRMTPTRGLQEPRDLTVKGVFDSMFGLMVYADFDWLNHQISEAGAVSTVQLKADFTPEQLARFTALLKRSSNLAGYEVRAQQRATMQHDFVEKMGGMAYPLVLFGAVIFFGAVLNAGLIGIIERTRELSTYRVLGYRPLEVGNLLLRESTALYFTGTLLGLPLGWWMLLGMDSQYQNDMYAMPSVIHAQSWILSVTLSVAFVLACQLVIQRSINRMNWREALAMKE